MSELSVFYGRGEQQNCYPEIFLHTAIATAVTVTTAIIVWLFTKTKLTIGRTDLPFRFGLPKAKEGSHHPCRQYYKLRVPNVLREVSNTTL